MQRSPWMNSTKNEGNWSYKHQCKDTVHLIIGLEFIEQLLCTSTVLGLKNLKESAASALSSLSSDKGRSHF